MTQRQRFVVVFGIIFTLALAILLFMMFSQMKKKAKPPKAAPIVRLVEIDTVKYSEIETNVFGTGRVLSQSSVDIISEVQGKLLKGEIDLKKGASFYKGQLLAKVYDKDAVYAMKSRKSSFLTALANILPDLKIDYPDSYQKWFDFFESIEIEKDLPTLPETSSNQEKIFLASRGILRDYYSIKADEERLKKYYLIAPFNGAIQDVMLEVGSVANPGSRIARIIKTTGLEIEVPLQVNDASWVRKGQNVIIRSEQGTEKGKGIITRISGFVAQNSQSINVYIKVLSSNKELFSGQYLGIEIPGMKISNAMEIPRNAVFNSNMVWVVENGFLAKKEVQILKTNEKTLLFRGLEEGTELVVQPLANANVNMAVQTKYLNLHKRMADTVEAEQPKEKTEKED